MGTMMVPVQDLIVAIGYAVFLLVAFGYRTVIAARQGDSGWRRPVSRTDAFGEIACVVGCALSGVAPILSATGILPAGNGPRALRLAAGLLLVLGGALVALHAQAEMGSSWRAGVEASRTLVTTGLFRRIRNPFYVGCMVASLGVLVAVPTIVALSGLLLHIVASLIIVIGVEEPMLERTHGRTYEEYRQSSGRFLPRMSRGRR